MNFPIIVAAALIPMVIGFVWYSPKVLGKAWMEASGLTEEKMKGANMPLIFGLSFVFAILLGLGLYGIVIHQAGAMSLFVGLENEAEVKANFLAEYGTLYRSFKHGALHGTIAAIIIALPLLGINALFERKSVKYVAINLGYWVVTLALMGGVICQWA